MKTLRSHAGRLLRSAYSTIEEGLQVIGTSPDVDEIKDLAATWGATQGVQGHPEISFESTVQSNKAPMLLPAEPYRLSERMQV